MKFRIALAVAAALAVAVLAAILWRSRPQPAAPSPIVAPAPAPTPAPASAAVVPASTPAISHVIEQPVTATAPTAADIEPALVELLGRKAVASFLRTDDFARRLVATVDNLGRTHAPASMWPVQPTAEKFTVQAQGSESTIAADNSLRYTPFVLLTETVSIGRAMDVYVRLYPLLQQAYEDIGYPGKNFNDRLIEVIDQLLATPDAVEPVKVVLIEVKGPIPATRPWVHYQYADADLEALSSGQKILLRVGAVNERRLKAKLREIRQELTRRSTQR